MAGVPTLIFGPSGDVASHATLIAAEQGAKIYLAMRDPNKMISGISAQQEKDGGFERIRADLTKPETVKAAVAKSGAKRVFLYLIMNTPDHMRGTIETLKESGVEFVVFLSSFSVHGDRASVPQTDFIPWQHAQVELVLEEVFGAKGYVAVRPAFFSSNTFAWASGTKAGEVSLPYAESKLDFITALDIGRVMGSILAQGPDRIDENAIYLCGPKVMSQREAVGIVSQVLGKEIKIKDLNEEEGVEYLKTLGIPEQAAGGMVAGFRESLEGGTYAERYRGPEYKAAVANILKYGGKAPTSYLEWVEGHKHIFA